MQSLEVKASCFSTVSMKTISEFVVRDGSDVRLSNALQVLSKEVGIERVRVEMETLVPRNDRDKLRYYMRIKQQMKCIGFSIEFKAPNENTQTLTFAYQST